MRHHVVDCNAAGIRKQSRKHKSVYVFGLFFTEPWGYSYIRGLVNRAVNLRIQQNEAGTRHEELMQTPDTDALFKSDGEDFKASTMLGGSFIQYGRA